MKNERNANETTMPLSERVTALRNEDGRRARDASPPSANDAARGRKWKLVAGIGIPALLVISTIGVAAIASITTSFSSIHGNNFEYDESTFSVTSHGMDLQASALAAAGDSSGAAIEMASPKGAANTAVAAGDWFYQVSVDEAAVDSVASGTFKAELFVDGASKGALYMTQGTADATAAEGVKFTWSLGSELAGTAAYVVKVTIA